MIKIEAEHFCENTKQKTELRKLGIGARLVPAFWGEINDFPVSFKYSQPFKIYICGHPKREEEYGFETVKVLAKRFPDIEFHIYGANLDCERENIVNHGIVPEEQFNREIKDYHCFLRLNRHDGFSDALAKAILMGQHSISKVWHLFIPSYQELSGLVQWVGWVKSQKEPSLMARKYYLKQFNNYRFITVK